MAVGLTSASLELEIGQSVVPCGEGGGGGWEKGVGRGSQVIDRQDGVSVCRRGFVDCTRSCVGVIGMTQGHHGRNALLRSISSYKDKPYKCFGNCGMCCHV